MKILFIQTTIHNPLVQYSFIAQCSLAKTFEQLGVEITFIPTHLLNEEPVGIAEYDLIFIVDLLMGFHCLDANVSQIPVNFVRAARLLRVPIYVYVIESFFWNDERYSREERQHLYDQRWDARQKTAKQVAMWADGFVTTDYFDARCFRELGIRTLYAPFASPALQREKNYLLNDRRPLFMGSMYGYRTRSANTP